MEEIEFFLNKIKTCKQIDVILKRGKDIEILNQQNDFIRAFQYPFNQDLIPKCEENLLEWGMLLIGETIFRFFINQPERLNPEASKEDAIV